MSIELSIVIPVYNVEKYIKVCLDSILGQIETYQLSNIELIIVNDGTQDESIVRIADELSKYSTIIKLINQDNQGLSIARNVGLSTARGKWVWFFDSDDTAVPDTFLNLLDLLGSTEEEVIACDLILENEGTGERKVDRNRSSVYGQYNIPYHYFFVEGKASPIQRFIFKRSFLEDHNLEFYPRIYHEDMEFMLRFIPLASSMLVVNQAFYNYLVRSSGSITSTFSSKRVDSYLLIIDHVIELIAHVNDPRLEDFYISRINIYTVAVLNLLGQGTNSQCVNQYLDLLHKKVKPFILKRFLYTQKYYSKKRSLLLLLFKLNRILAFNIFVRLKMK